MFLSLDLELRYSRILPHLLDKILVIDLDILSFSCTVTSSLGVVINSDISHSIYIDYGVGFSLDFIRDDIDCVSDLNEFLLKCNSCLV